MSGWGLSDSSSGEEAGGADEVVIAPAAPVAPPPLPAKRGRGRPRKVVEPPPSVPEVVPSVPPPALSDSILAVDRPSVGIESGLCQ